jgi:hypothetical protein
MAIFIRSSVPALTLSDLHIPLLPSSFLNWHHYSRFDTVNGLGCCRGILYTTTMASLAAAGRALSSLGFSGAGFLTSYHLGAADCLLKRGLLLQRGELPVDDKTPVLTGVSGGALVATAVSIGVRPEDGMMATLAIAEQSRKAGGMLDHLRPG